MDLLRAPNLISLYDSQDSLSQDSHGQSEVGFAAPWALAHPCAPIRATTWKQQFVLHPFNQAPVARFGQTVS